MNGVMSRYQPKIQLLMEQLRPARLALEAAITADTFDEATIRQKNADVAAVDAELAVIRAQVNAEIVALLTPEQRKLLQDRRDQMANHPMPPPPVNVPR